MEQHTFLDKVFITLFTLATAIVMFALFVFGSYVVATVFGGLR